MNSKPPLPLRRKLLFAAITTCILLGLVEVGFRIAGYGREVLFVPEEGLGWHLMPNQDRVTPNGLPVHINAFGYRDEDFPRERPAGEFRTLLIGDSLTFGIDVAQEKTFAALLHRRFLASHGPGKVRVVNGGTQGFDARQYEIELQRYGFGVNPNLVLVMLFANDLEINEQPEPWFEFPGRNLLRYTATFEAFEKLYRRRITPLRGTKEERDAASMKKAVDEYVGRTAIDVNTPVAKMRLDLITNILKRMKEQCAQRGVAFGVVILPAWTFTQNPDTAHLNRLFERSCEDQDIRYLNLLPLMAPKHDEIWLPWDVGHFSEVGHELAARFIGEWLVGSNLIPQS